MAHTMTYYDSYYDSYYELIEGVRGRELLPTQKFFFNKKKMFRC